MPSTDKPRRRPAARDVTVSARIPPAVFAKAKRRARKRPLSAIIRAWLSLFAAGQLDAPPILPDENIRAQKRPRPPASK